MLFIDLKYAALIGSRLKNFKSKNQYVWQYTCPHCSDWTSEKPKARAYIYRMKTELFTKCHHCGHGSNLGNLIKHFDETLYKQYIVERYQNNASKYTDHKDIAPLFKSTQVVVEDDILSRLKRLDTLPSTHPVRTYVQKRMITEDQESLFYYTSRFKEFVNSVVQKFIEPIENDHPRLVIPYLNEHGKVVMFNARAFGKEIPKYMKVRIDEDSPKVFGLERVKRDRTIYVTEGEIDSLMIENGIASGGASSLDSPAIQGMKSRVVLVHDNDPRNPEVGAIIEKTIAQDYAMFIPPDDFKYKDLNEAIMGGLTKAELKSIIDENSFQGLKAKLRFTNWKKY